MLSHMYECVLSTCVFTSEFCLHFLFFLRLLAGFTSGDGGRYLWEAVANVYFKRGRNMSGEGAANGTQMIFYR